MSTPTGTRTLGEVLGRDYHGLIRDLEPVLDLVSLRDLRFGLAEMPNISWADAVDRPVGADDGLVASRGQVRALRERLVHLDSITRYPQPLIVELGELLANMRSIRSQWVEICVDLWGWDGSGRKTPELVAWRHHVSRERVDQVERTLQGRLSQIGRPAYLPSALAIAGIITGLGDSASRFHVARLAMAQELITDPSEIDALEALEAVGLLRAGTWPWAAPVQRPVHRARRAPRRPPHVEAQLAEFRTFVSALETRRDVYLVSLEPTEKSGTIRRRLLQAASDAGVEIALRKHAEGWVVGLMTPDRRRR